MPPAIISDMNSDEYIDEDISAEEMMKALRESLSHIQQGQRQNPEPTTPPPSRHQRPNNEGRPGLSNIANMVHFKPPKLSEEEQLQKVLEESKIESLTPDEQLKLALAKSMRELNVATPTATTPPSQSMSPDEQLKLALAESMRDLNVVPSTATDTPLVSELYNNDNADDEEEEEVDEEEMSEEISSPTSDAGTVEEIENNDLEKDEQIRIALAMSLDPNEQENPEYRDHFKRLKSSHGGRIGANVQGAEALPTDFDTPIYSLEELRSQEKLMRRSSRNSEIKRPKSTIGSRIAANFPNAGEVKEEFFNEDLYQSQLQEAIEKSKREIKRCTSLSPRSTPTINYSKVASTSVPGQRLSPIPGCSSSRSNDWIKIPSAQPPRSSSSSRMVSNASPTVTRWNTNSAGGASGGASKRGKYRPVVIDGCNVGFLHGRNQKFSAQGLWIIYDYFINKGYVSKDIIIIVKHMPRLNEEDAEMLKNLKEAGIVTEAPSRHVGNQLIRSDDDLFILSTAKDIGKDHMHLQWARKFKEVWAGQNILIFMENMQSKIL